MQAEPDRIQAEEGRFLIVGLGNPGPDYRHNRHNVGFMALDAVAQALGIELGRVKFQAIVGDGQYAGASLLLAKPQTFMNNSGRAVGQLARFYKIPPQRVLVIYDEIDLPLGAIRLRRQGGSGGHNGMRSVIQQLGQEFPRLRLGVGRPPGRMPPAAYVLRNFSREEEAVVAEMVARAVSAVKTFLQEGVELAMTRHNQMPPAEEDAGQE